MTGAAKKATMKSTVELFSETSKNPVPPIAKVDQLENVAGIFASSGTTGAAKGSHPECLHGGHGAYKVGGLRAFRVKRK